MYTFVSLVRPALFTYLFGHNLKKFRGFIEFFRMNFFGVVLYIKYTFCAPEHLQRKGHCAVSG